MIGLPNPWVILGAGVASIGLLLGGYSYGTHTRGVSCDRDAARVQATAASELADWQAKARASEIASQAATNKIAEAYERGKTDAQATEAATVAGLRAGTLRLQSRWTACQADLSKAGATAAELAAAIADRDESASRIVLAAALCDAQVRGLQDYARQVSQ